ncbi:DUF3795 domain-containing protein [Anaeroselena agilis]|uniref:DUF3795 domain-containing protein n=1 Tax=Anaeroselena agilis TaxID=3063788 RepID=A0ABU3NZN4_9FIRM|nr:DUF3795 domain-containing protein [Selenomonadales bacterium 4137-cl]
MEYHEAVARLAPCGLDCSRCADFRDGEIRALSARLKELLGNYQRLAAMKAAGRPEFAHYGQFAAILDSFAAAPCSGCRGDNVTCPLDCTAKTCHKDNGVDFCFQCGEYPCDKQFEGKLRDRWRSINDRMREIGAAAYCEEQGKLPRY